MRCILFRGQDVLGEWHSGLLAHIGNAWYISNNAGVPTAYEVIPTTIGEFTGLTDENGEKIFEGDVIEARYVTYGAPYRGVVVFADGAFCVKGENGYPAIDLLKDYKIVGQQPAEGD